MRFATLAACATLFALPVFVASTSAASAPRPTLAAGGWTIDTGHSHIGFKTAHLGVSHAHGRFNSFSGSIQLADNPAESKVIVEIDAKSIDTNSPDRDKHLRGTDFFNAVQHPKVNFESSKITKTSEGYTVEGNLSLLGVTKPVTATVVMVGATEHPRFGQVAGFNGSFSFKRSDFGMNYGVENGSLGDEVFVDMAFEVKAE